jgi:hypothetical protein
MATRTDHYPASSKMASLADRGRRAYDGAGGDHPMTRVDEGATRDMLYNFHKSLGVLILLLMTLRLINRPCTDLSAVMPGLVPGIPVWPRQRRGWPGQARP